MRQNKEQFSEDSSNKSCIIRKLLILLWRMRRVITYGGYFESFMETLSPEQRKKINYGLLILKSVDRLPAKFVKFIEDGIYELRTEFEGNIFRTFFIFDNGNLVVLFNGFQKKTQKTPRSEIEKAKRIKEEYYGRTRK